MNEKVAWFSDIWWLKLKFELESVLGPQKLVPLFQSVLKADLSSDKIQGLSYFTQLKNPEPEIPTMPNSYLNCFLVWGTWVPSG
jgi:hypothetical protein